MKMHSLPIIRHLLRDDAKTKAQDDAKRCGVNGGDDNCGRDRISGGIVNSALNSVNNSSINNISNNNVSSLYNLSNTSTPTTTQDTTDYPSKLKKYKKSFYKKRTGRNSPQTSRQIPDGFDSNSPNVNNRPFLELSSMFDWGAKDSMSFFTTPNDSVVDNVGRVTLRLS